MSTKIDFSLIFICLDHLIMTMPFPWIQEKASLAASAMMEVFPHPDSPCTTKGSLLSPNT